MMTRRNAMTLYQTGFQTGAFNMALDEALMEGAGGQGGEPSLRFFGWEPACVTLGCFQKVDEEVDVDACRVAGVDIVRRNTGGGTVFHNEELTYSIILPQNHSLIKGSIEDSYRVLCSGLMEGIKLLGLNPEFAPINDILVDGKKVSGNAQTRRGGMVLHHGTVLLGLDAALFGRLLKRVNHGGGKAVASLNDLLGRTISFEEAEAAMIEGYQKVLGMKLESASISEKVMARTRELAENKYGSANWTNKTTTNDTNVLGTHE
jgi:lipoate-protein ligase A